MRLIGSIGVALVQLALAGCATTAPHGMIQETLAAHIESFAGEVRVSANVIEFRHQDVEIACVSDATHDRMRLIAAIAHRDSVAAEHLDIMLTANFHTTLDARYALSKGIVYAAFLHPLSTLTPEDLESAIRQVAALARNFGSTYSSDELIYGAEAGQEI